MPLKRLSMLTERNYVMSIAGFDPSGGAGVLADSKTFEQHKVYGLSVMTANRVQTESKFYTIKWSSIHDVVEAVDVLLDAYPVKAIKTGIVPSFDFLWQVVTHIKKRSSTLKIVVDPVLTSTTGFAFQEVNERKKLYEVLEQLSLITPNVPEAVRLGGYTQAEDAAKALASYCPVLLKGGHHNSAPGVDYLYHQGQCVELHPVTINVSPKHGSGCVLSAAIVANLAMELSLEASCIKAKKYVEQFLGSTNSLLGYHVQ
jgi:hydroxymethylpyrimidine/phosphomethylpyrimidine kinase